MSPGLSLPRVGSFSESTLDGMTFWMHAAHFQGAAEIEKVMARVEGHLGVRGSVHLKNTPCIELSRILEVFHLAGLHVILTASPDVGLLIPYK